MYKNFPQKSNCTVLPSPCLIELRKSIQRQLLNQPDFDLVKLPVGFLRVTQLFYVKGICRQTQIAQPMTSLYSTLNQSKDFFTSLMI